VEVAVGDDGIVLELHATMATHRTNIDSLDTILNMGSILPATTLSHCMGNGSVRAAEQDKYRRQSNDEYPRSSEILVNVLYRMHDFTTPENAPRKHRFSRSENDYARGKDPVYG
jgi:hypothetical protein